MPVSLAARLRPMTRTTRKHLFLSPGAGSFAPPFSSSSTAHDFGLYCIRDERTRNEMLTTTLSFQNMHNHGELFVNLLKARRKSFIVQNNWNLPEAEGMEFDQYDTPASRWIAVHENGEVLAGIRLTPTTAKCGMYTYMIRDAQKGMLEGIPSDLLYFEAPVDEKIWESSRVFVSSNVPSNLRIKVQTELMFELINVARSMGANQILGLVPAVWSRWIGRLHLHAEPAGPVMDIDGMRVQVAMMTLNSNLH
jgi:acyl homoserine lactone synthase